MLQAGVSLRVSLHLGSKNECSPGSPVLIRNDTVSIYTGAPQPQLFGVRRNFIQGNLNLTHSKYVL